MNHFDRFQISGGIEVITFYHLLQVVITRSGKETISKSLQLIAGRTAQEFNLRKKRKGACREDRYHSTAVQTDDHLVKCLVYIDLNKVSAGVVQHPSEYLLGEYNEIHNPPERYSIIDRKTLHDLLGIQDDQCFQKTHFVWVESESKMD